MQLPYALLVAIENYLNGNSSPEEEQLVYGWYNSFTDATVEIPAHVADLRDKVSKRIWARLSDTIEAKEDIHQKKNSAFYNRRWFRIAAAAIVLLTTGGYMFFTRFDQRQQANTTMVAAASGHDVQPGGTRALLTLDDGSQIVLDSASNGLLMQQGNTAIVKQGNGQLRYTSQQQQRESAIHYNTLSTPRGGQYQLTLSDGSRVWLNAISSIRYPAAFNEKERLVEITGEVYFEIAKDAARPFKVTVMGSVKKKQEVMVLGTHFNIMAYDDEAVVKTTLLEGSVNVVNRESGIGNDEQPGRSVILKPGQQSQIINNQLSIINNIDLDQEMAWKNGLFQFKDAPVEVLMRQLARWYDIDIRYEGPLPSLETTGKAPRNISLATMLKILELSDIHYTIEGKTLTITP